MMPRTPLDEGPPWFGSPDRSRKPLFAAPPANPEPGAVYVDLYGGTGVDRDGDEYQSAFMVHWLNEHRWAGSPAPVRGQVFHTYLRAWVSREQRHGHRVLLLPGLVEVPVPADPSAGWSWEAWRDWLLTLAKFGHKAASQVPA